jgi:hypothetical protein
MNKLTERLFSEGEIPVVCPVKKTERQISLKNFGYLFRRTADRTQHERVDGYYCGECDKVHPLLESIRPYFGC